jgi:hypothetical protein
VSSVTTVGLASETEDNLQMVVMELLPSKREACHVNLVSVFVSAALKMGAKVWTETTKQHEGHKTVISMATVGRIKRFHMD